MNTPDDRTALCCRILLLVVVLAGLCVGTGHCDAGEWGVVAGAGSLSFRGTLLGASSAGWDGYDGQPVYDPTGKTGCALLLYRENGPAWSGPTGFYYKDYAPPLSSGQYYVWNDIYLWAQNYTEPSGIGQLQIMPYYPVAPSYYTYQLVLDYVPESLGYAGPTEFVFSVGALLDVPIPTVTNPLDGVRMHLTVYAGPIPEPSSLLALAAPLAGLVVWRRRRR